MGKNRYHINVEHAQVVVLHKIKLPQHQILKQIGVNSSSIQRARKIFTLKGIYGNQKKSGRPRNTTAQDDNTIKIVACSPTSSCKKAHANLLKKVTGVSVSTIF